tara:strand:- start:438 stop:4355 length:3918 start_codon:yes stop_codon:yes gene_type:complete
MTKIIETSVADHIIVGRVEPFIYAFSTKDAPKALKVGDTYRPVAKRLEEWRDKFSDLKKEYEHSAQLDDDRIFRDFAVHTYLQDEKKRMRLNPEDIDNPYYSREFFKNATKIDLDEAIASIKESASKNDGRYKFYTSDRLPETFTYERGSSIYAPRPNQEKTISAFGDAVKKGHTNLLMYAVMRFGKSFTAMCCAIHDEMDSKIVVILSAKADVQAEWKQTVETHKKFLEFDFLNKDDLDKSNSIIAKKLAEDKRVVVFLTLQDLQGDNLKERHEELFSKKLDLLIIDETHYGARAEEYGKVLKNLGLKKNEIDKELKDEDDVETDNTSVIKVFDAKVSLHLSGTPYRILMGDEFTEDQIIAFYQFVDIVEDQKKWDNDEENLDKKEWDNPYYGFPEMVRFAFHPNKSTRERMKELRENGKTHAFSELFRPNSITKVKDGSHKEFKYKKEILELFQVIDGKKTDSNLLSFLNYDKIQEGKLCRHIVCVLPFKASCDALEKLITDNTDKFLNLSEYEIVNIAGVDNEGLYKTTRSVKSIISKCEDEDKKTITFTVNRMLTGTTVPEWDTMFYFKDTASPQEYDQSIFRIQNQYIKSYKDEDEEIIKYNMKPQTLLVDFDPNRLFQMQVQKSLFYNINVAERGNVILEDRIKKELEISPIISLNKNKLIKIKPTNIIDAVRNYSRDRSILEEASDVPFDSKLMENERLKALIDSINAIDEKKGLEINPAEGDGTEIDTGNSSEAGLNQKNNSTNNKNNSDEEDDSKLIEKKLAAYRLRILFYAFLTKYEVNSIGKIIESITESDDNKRILKNVGIYTKDLETMLQASSEFILNQFEYKIKNINDLGRDKSLSPTERASMAMKKFARVSVSEVVMPARVADDLVELIPADKIKEGFIILDLASKQGEIAVAVYKAYSKKLPNLMNNIYSVTTSSLAYELTRKVYESLGLPLKNILDFNSFDLIAEDNNEIMVSLKKLKPDVIISGPPYQKTDGGGRKGSGSGSAIYHNYFEIAKQLNPTYIAMILKASWYSGGKGKGLPEFRQSFIDDKRIAILHDYPDPTIYFESPVSLRGGVCTFLWDTNHKDNCHVFNHINKDIYDSKRPLKTNNNDILIRYNLGVEILKKVIKTEEEKIIKGAYSRNAFKLASNNKDVKSNRNIAKKYKVYLAKGNIGYIVKSKIPEYNDKKSIINKWKVLVAKASPGYDELPHSIISKPIISEPGSLCTDTHLLVRVVNNKREAENLIYYMKTKFFRFMMLLMKNSHNMNQEIFRFVPVQDLSKKWSDIELYKKYNIQKFEIKFINSVIKERD